ncbi:hypothetical protein OG905_01460 [Streptomyces sp. NBC_00322]|nr:hypothetical protein [Streptomyces sp. NBC_00322]
MKTISRSVPSPLFTVSRQRTPRVRDGQDSRHAWSRLEWMFPNDAGIGAMPWSGRMVRLWPRYSVLLYTVKHRPETWPFRRHVLALFHTDSPPMNPTYAVVSGDRGMSCETKLATPV